MIGLWFCLIYPILPGCSNVTSIVRATRSVLSVMFAVYMTFTCPSTVTHILHPLQRPLFCVYAVSHTLFHHALSHLLLRCIVREGCIWHSCEFNYHVAVRSFSTLVLMSKHEIHHQIPSKLKVLCVISYMIITHIWLINNMFYISSDNTVL